VGQNESIDSALKRFKKKLENEGITKEYKEKQFFVKPSKIRHDHDRSIQHRQKRKKLLSQKRGLRKDKRRNEKRDAQE
jgi:small subunit ribosomal protein S21